VLRFLGFRLCGNVKPDDASSGSSSSELQAQVTRRISDDLKAWITIPDFRQSLLEEYLMI
jgi:hypothetical protein